MDKLQEPPIELRCRSKDATADETSLKVSNGSGSPEEVERGATFISQTRTRRLFSGAQLFAFSLAYMSSWEGILSTMYTSMYNGGPRALFFGYMVVFCGACAQSASLSEMASLQPVAGAQYHWTFYLGPPKVKRIATWVQGWASWFGFISLLAGVANGTIVSLESIIALNYPSYVTGGWHTSVLVIAMCVIQGLMNMYSYRLIPWIEILAGVMHIAMFIIVVTILSVMGTRHSAEYVVLSTNVSSGWKGEFIPWNIGTMAAVWSLTGFDSAIHMSEETRQAKSAVPRAIFWSVFLNGILAFIMSFVYVIHMGDIQDTLDTTNPIFFLLYKVTGSRSGATSMAVLMWVTSFSCNIASIASTSRITWAWARDGGLPRYLAYIHPKYRVPTRAIVLTIILVSCINLLTIGNATYVALSAITGLCSLLLYLSYAIAIACFLGARYTNPDMKLGEWNLGRYGVYINIFGLVYSLWIIFWEPWPTTLPVTASNMNYCGPVVLAILIVVFTSWFVWARKNWAGPNITIRDYIVAHSG